MTHAISRILVPVDFSASSDEALRYAASLAGRLGASLELLHVVDDPISSGSWRSEVDVPNAPELLNNLVADARRRLSNLREVVASHGVPVSTVVLTGRPAHAIVDHAKAGRFDLVVMGAHGRTGLAHLFVGSVAEAVVRRAPCPVLTVRQTPHPAETRTSRSATTVV